MEPTKIICPVCEGEGEVGFNRSRNNDPQQDDSARCPTCHGEGAIAPDEPIITLEDAIEAAMEDAAEARAEARADAMADPDWGWA